MADTTSARALRTDAARNRARILEAAEAVFARDGLAASMGDIAQAAGLGVGTLYRRFESKSALVEAIFRHRIDDLAAVIDRCRAQPSAWDGLTMLMRLYVGALARDRAVMELATEVTEPALRVLRERIVPALADLVERAQSEGALREDFTAADVPVLTHAIGAIAHSMPSGGPRLAQRHLELLLKGIAATPDPVPIPPPLADEDFGVWLQAAVL
ncbi:TetR/AcrR family transcriptional regulator [Microbacterium sp. 18062]|uniref:TetR/AcrR family transcriptional regulator n=1 Tax=Microbacterium sp. 18062 TaxID=2681410 RepID=UPI00135ADE96|nr:TetR/AcrR family transcriptional regulator [Microbacterium sp. 18062]